MPQSSKTFAASWLFANEKHEWPSGGIALRAVK